MSLTIFKNCIKALDIYDDDIYDMIVIIGEFFVSIGIILYFKSFTGFKDIIYIFK